MKYIFLILFLIASLATFGQIKNISGSWEVITNCPHDTFHLTCDTVYLKKRNTQIFKKDTISEIRFGSNDWSFYYEENKSQRIIYDELDSIGFYETKIITSMNNTYTLDYNLLEYMYKDDTLMLIFRNEPYPLTWYEIQKMTTKEVEDFYGKFGKSMLIKYVAQQIDDDNLTLYRIKED
ncbi:MAG: hypothetical protein K9H64_22695 [Bacteroidales bacterium]|nr:hypothetical protein [Bacteroidales bacterium]MCF8458848.1 hypothetical protein [Bacteroidales bacterium]